MQEAAQMQEAAKRLECHDLLAIYSKSIRGPIESVVMACSFNRQFLEAMIAERREKEESVHPTYQGSYLSIGPVPVYNYTKLRPTEGSTEVQQQAIARILKKSAAFVGGNGMVLQTLFWDCINNPLYGFIKEDRLGQSHDSLLSIAADDRAAWLPHCTSDNPVQLDAWYEEGIMNA